MLLNVQIGNFVVASWAKLSIGLEARKKKASSPVSYGRDKFGHWYVRLVVAKSPSGLPSQTTWRFKQNKSEEFYIVATYNTMYTALNFVN